jgi:hypothetical protein
MQLMVDDLDAWWVHIQNLNLEAPTRSSQGDTLSLTASQLHSFPRGIAGSRKKSREVLLPLGRMGLRLAGWREQLQHLSAGQHFRSDSSCEG